MEDEGFEDFLTPGELARALRVRSSTLANWRSDSRGPDYFRLEGNIRYRMSDVEAWLQGRRVRTLEGLGRPSPVSMTNRIRSAAGLIVAE